MPLCGQNFARRTDERRLADHHLVDHGAERVEVGGGAERPPLDLLGRHIGRRAGQHRRRKIGRVVGAGQPEVEQLDVALGRDLDVRRLEVAMDDAVGAQTVERFEDLLEALVQLGVVALAPLAADVAPQIDAGRELHDEVGGVGGDHQIVERDEIWMYQPRRQPVLVLETQQPFARRGQHFDGHTLAGLAIDRFVDDAHAAASDLADDAVARIFLQRARQRRQGCSRERHSRPFGAGGEDERTGGHTGRNVQARCRGGRSIKLRAYENGRRGSGPRSGPAVPGDEQTTVRDRVIPFAP